jgi:2,5-diketo-D-gluconate reductase A
MTPRITLNDSTTIPQIGYGTLNVPPDRSGSAQATAETARIVGLAIQAGYRHLDTAQMYGNETGVGRAIAESGLPREQLHVTTKLGNGNHRPDDVRRSFEASLDKLGLDQVDLFLMHWPLPTLYDGDYVSTWQAMTELVKDGRLRTVGVSNFHAEHLDRVIGDTGIVPAVNQIEVHPYFRNDAARAASARHGIVVEAWSPLGQGTVLNDRVIGRIAHDLSAAPAQVILRWHVQHGHIILPKTMTQDRMRENLEAFDLTLSAEQMAAIDALDKGPDGRHGPNPDTFDWIPGPAPQNGATT